MGFKTTKRGGVLVREELHKSGLYDTRIEFEMWY